VKAGASLRVAPHIPQWGPPKTWAYLCEPTSFSVALCVGPLCTTFHYHMKHFCLRGLPDRGIYREFGGGLRRFYVLLWIMSRPLLGATFLIKVVRVVAHLLTIVNGSVSLFLDTVNKIEVDIRQHKQIWLSRVRCLRLLHRH